MLNFEVYGVTNSGCIRQENEDCVDWHLRKDKKLAMGVLADGMGGYFGGAVASKMAVNTVLDNLMLFFSGASDHKNTDMEETLLLAGAEANAAVISAREEQAALAEMGTTLVALVAYGDSVSVMHAGDSRCYRVLDGEIDQLTTDDSVVQKMIEDGSLSHGDALRSPFRSMLTKSLGVEKSLEYSLQTFKAKVGEMFLLCSNGLYHTIGKNCIKEVLDCQASAKRQAFELVDRSISNRAEDNISALLVKVVA